MTRDEFLDEQYRVSVRSGMNQRYHQSRAKHFSSLDRGVKVSVGLLAVSGAILAFTDYAWFSIAAACMSALAATVLNVFPISEWYCTHVELLRRWSDLREEVDSLGLQVGAKPTKAQKEILIHLSSKTHRISGEESKRNEKVWLECEHEELKFRRPAEETTDTQKESPSLAPSTP